MSGTRTESIWYHIAVETVAGCIELCQPAYKDDVKPKLIWSRQLVTSSGLRWRSRTRRAARSLWAIPWPEPKSFGFGPHRCWSRHERQSQISRYQSQLRNATDNRRSCSATKVVPTKATADFVLYLRIEDIKLEADAHEEIVERLECLLFSSINAELTSAWNRIDYV